MPKFVIERELPRNRKAVTEELQGISQKSCSVLEELGPKVQWLHSDVIDDKIYCVCETRWFGVIYLGKDDAPNDEIVLMAGTYTLYAGYTSMRGWVVIPTFLTAGMIRWH